MVSPLYILVKNFISKNLRLSVFFLKWYCSEGVSSSISNADERVFETVYGALLTLFRKCLRYEIAIVITTGHSSGSGTYSCISYADVTIFERE